MPPSPALPLAFTPRPANPRNLTAREEKEDMLASRTYPSILGNHLLDHPSFPEQAVLLLCLPHQLLGRQQGTRGNRLLALPRL